MAQTTTEPKPMFALAALPMALAAPVRAVRRTDHARLWEAWVVHLLGLVLLWLVTVVLVAWSAARISASLADLPGLVIERLEMAREFEPMQVARELGAALFAIEFPVFITAILLAPWGARDEGGGDAQLRSLKRLLLATPHVVTIVAVVGIINVWLNRSYAAFLQQFGANPFLSSNIDWNAVQAAMPWWLRHRDTITLVLMFGAIGYGVVTALRVVGDMPRRPRCCWPGVCERCGYLLLGVGRDGDCAECGHSVAASLSPAARPGVPWEHRREIGRVRAWLATAAMAVFRPWRLASRLRLFACRTDHRWFLAPVFVLLFAIGTSGSWRQARSEYHITWDWLISAAASGGATCLVGLGVILLVATVCGARRRPDKRNLMAASMQASAYLGGLLVAWAAVAWGQLLLFEAWNPEKRLWRLADQIGTEPELLVSLMYLVPNGGFFVTYVLLAGGMARRLMYANR